jgi:HisJ family histidinol phosphate phosphatase
MPYSHHSHSGQFCGHAKDTLEEVVQAAIAKGFHSFALTEHIPRPYEDFYPEEVSLPCPLACVTQYMITHTFADKQSHRRVLSQAVR